MDLLELFSKIKTFVFDVDGVLTDGSLFLTDDGKMLRSMNIKDGYALQKAVKAGYAIWIITGGKSEPVRLRLNKLGIEEVHLGIDNKAEFLDEIYEAKVVDYNTMLYMGDDIPDYIAMQKCLLPCCPSDAVNEIKEISKYISPFPGGKGCARDVIEMVLKLQEKW